MVAGKRRLMGDIKWQGANSEVLFLRKENSQLRKLVVILSLTNVVLKEAWLEQAQVGKIQSRDSCISQGRLPSIVNFWSIISDRSFKCEVKVSKLGLGTSFYLDTCHVRKFLHYGVPWGCGPSSTSIADFSAWYSSSSIDFSNSVKKGIIGVWSAVTSYREVVSVS